MFSRPHGGRIEDGPAFGGGALQQVVGGVDREGAVGSRDSEHGGVVDRVAEDGVGVGDADAGEGGDLGFVGGDGNQPVRDEAGVGIDLDLGGEDAVGLDVGAANGFFGDPVAGRDRKSTGL